MDSKIVRKHGVDLLVSIKSDSLQTLVVSFLHKHEFYLGDTPIAEMRCGFNGWFAWRSEDSYYGSGINSDVHFQHIEDLLDYVAIIVKFNIEKSISTIERNKQNFTKAEADLAKYFHKGAE